MVPVHVRERLFQKRRLSATPTAAPSSYSSTTKSKRHSLGILPASLGPQPLHLLDGTITSSSPTSVSSPSRSTSPSIGQASRRRSSIYYCPPDQTPDYTSSSINSNNAACSPSSARGTQSVHVGAPLSRSSSVGRGSPALKARYGEIQRMSLPLEKEKRPPLTLAGKCVALSFFLFFLGSSLAPGTRLACHRVFGCGSRTNVNH